MALDLAELEDDISDAIGNSLDMDWTCRDGAKSVVRMLVDQGWLTRRMETDPDLPCEAGR